MKSTEKFTAIAITLIGLGLGGCAGTPDSSDSTEFTPVATGDRQPGQIADPEQRLMYQLMLAEMAWKQEDTATAITQYLNAARDTGDPSLAERATRMAEFAQANDQAFEAAKLWAQGEPDNAEVHQLLGVLYTRTGNIDKAVEHFNRVVELSSDIRQAYIRIGSQLGKESGQESVLAVLEAMTSGDNVAPFAWFTYAHVAARYNRLQLARTQVDKVLAAQPDWADAVVLKARIHQLMQDMDGALDAYRSALSGPLKKDTRLRMAYGRLLMDEKRLKEAREQYIILARQLPDDADILYGAALLSLQLEKFKDARVYLKRMLSKNTRTDEARYYLGQVEERQKKYSKALSYYRKVTSGEYYLSAQMRISVMWARQGKLDKALKHLRGLSAETEQEQVQLLLLEGDLMMEAHRYEQAFEVYDRALQDLPNNSNLLYARAITAEKLDRLDVTERDLRVILDQDPNNVQALNALGYTLADRTTRYDEALQYIRRAYELEPDDAAIVDSMGWIHYRLGRKQEALDYLRKAMDILSDAEIAAHLGEVLWVSGNKKEAMKVWNKALKQTPKSKVIMDVMRRFGL